MDALRLGERDSSPAYEQYCFLDYTRNIRQAPPSITARGINTLFYFDKTAFQTYDSL